MSELKIIPTFHLRGINPVEILARYKKKDFPPIAENKVNISLTTINVLPKFSYDKNDETFIFIDKSGSKNIYSTTNQSSFTSWREKEKHNPSTPCDWCHYPVGEKCVPIPLKMVVKNVYIGDTPYCSFQCCLAGLKRDQGVTYISRDPLYKDSEILLKYLYGLQHKDKTLRPAPDWRLLDINGGPLSREDFCKNFTYLRTPNIIVPSKVCYLRIEK